jgi:putative toxin-antitoxin system toxin component, PIN family
MPEPIPRVVFDCNLFVQGIANRNSPARKALRLFFNGAILLFVSEPILRELRDVLNRSEVRRRLPGINDRIINAFLTKLEAKAILIANVPEEFHYERDRMTRCI